MSAEAAFLRETRTSYDAIAGAYAAEFAEELAGKPYEKAMLGAFAELVAADGGGPVVEAGSGPGQVTAYLARLGVDVTGVELSPRMVESARERYPAQRFVQGTMTDLAAAGVADGSLGGIAAVYSVIHIPTPELPGVLAGFRRALRPGGRLLLVFQTGDELIRRTEAFGQDIALEYHWRQPEAVADLLAAAGLPVGARFTREPEAAEKSPRAALFAVRPA
ncbi:class I SAM-dependent methyltransferase [Streptomyces sp. V4-01]|uniref:Class I SAM-dependent methyltransferase n=1 Tax=Actinacidiphila polyblastidii TaxID=3110430 RepID=A0ABU7PKF3_9ACTN|nr:class I SAM-dependent methyltransferase [Streptomyces sp. V4-01]